MEKYALIESFVDLLSTDGTRRIRVWRSEEYVQPNYDHRDIFEAVRFNSHLDLPRLAEMIAALPRVATVHVTDISGPYTAPHAGVVLYNTWP